MIQVTQQTPNTKQMVCTAPGSAPSRSGRAATDSVWKASPPVKIRPL